MLFQKQAPFPDPKVTMEICVPASSSWDEKLKMEKGGYFKLDLFEGKLVVLAYLKAFDTFFLILAFHVWY